MSAFKITKITTPDSENSQYISFTLDSDLIPYGMQHNFQIMEKLPDYLFHYITTFFYEQKLQKFELNSSTKSLDNTITQTTFDTNHPDFFKLMTSLIQVVEQHFDVIIHDLESFNSPELFLQKIIKLNLYEKLNNQLLESNISNPKKNKI